MPAPDPRSLAERIACLDAGRRAELLAALSEDDAHAALESWAFWARRAQLPPPSRWSVWLLQAGRGFGKTRAGAEWVHWVAQGAGVRIALVGSTEEDVRRVMIEGASGVMASAVDELRPVWEPSRGVLSWRSGAQGFVYSGAKADGLRGPEHDYAWCDEIAKWAQGNEAWDNLRMGLRRGRYPQVMVTTTPRATPLMRRLVALPGVVVTRGRTCDNVHTSRSYGRGMLGRSRHGRAVGGALSRLSRECRHGALPMA